ncbi:MAG: GNAT family N-acetyltransferase [Parvularcula sp.]|jgi:putative acetyltransferase|nr:GNAT family N-acetyltransferase [Parvularcula sp.]
MTSCGLKPSPEALDVRPAKQTEWEELRQIVHDAVADERSAYDAVQTAAWAAHVPDADEWTKRIENQTVIVATRSSNVVGFMTLKGDGLLDLAFIHPQHQRTGVFRSLYKAIVAAARDQGIERLETKASLNACQPFRAMGFDIIEREKATLDGVTLERFRMQQRLSPT